MRDLQLKTTKPAGRNRLKKQRKPVNYRLFLKKALRFFGVVLVLALTGLTGYQAYGFVGRTTFLRLERIDVGELKRLTREEVIGLAGVKPGDEMLSLRLHRIGEQLAKNPWIEKVSIRRNFPHVLTIEVTEREPVAVVNMGYLYYMDKNGEVFKPLNEGDSLDFPVITGLSEEKMSKDPTGSRDTLKRARDLVDLLRSRNVFGLQDVSEIHCDEGYGFTLFAADGGVPIKLGSTAFEEKLERLARIYHQLHQELPKLVYIDLDYSDRIIVKKV